MGNSVPTWGLRISASPHTRTQVIKTQTVKGRVLNPQAEATYSFAGLGSCVGTKHFGLRTLHKRGSLRKGEPLGTHPATPES